MISKNIFEGDDEQEASKKNIKRNNSTVRIGLC